MHLDYYTLVFFISVIAGLALLIAVVRADVQRKGKHHGRPIRPENETAALYNILLSQLEKASGGERVVLVGKVADYVACNLPAVPAKTLKDLKRRLMYFDARRSEWNTGRMPPREFRNIQGV